MTIRTAKVTGVLIETACAFCKGRGNHDVVADDGTTLKCPAPCSCRGSGRSTAIVLLEDFIALLKHHGATDNGESA